MPVRMIAEFTKESAAQYISHLDLMRVMQRALRRADLPVEYSQGFSPHAVLSFATAVPVGCSSVCEVTDIHFARDVEPDAFLAAINAVLPGGMRVLRAAKAKDEAPAPMAAAHAARYRIEARPGAERCIEPFLAAEAFMAVKRGKKGAREVDIRPMVYELTAAEDDEKTILSCVLRHDNAQALKPTLLMEALGETPLSILRTHLYALKDQQWISLFDIYA